MDAEFMEMTLPNVRVRTCRVTGDFRRKNLADQRIRASVMLEELTAASHHSGSTETRIFHIMFEGNDLAIYRQVVEGMAEDFQEFYNQIRDAVSPFQGHNPMGLPPINPAGPDWWTAVQDHYKAVLASAQPQHPTGFEWGPVCSPAMLTVVPPGQPNAGTLASFSAGPVLHLFGP